MTYPYDYNRIIDEATQREAYRQRKDWFMADLLRDDLNAAGWFVEDMAKQLVPTGVYTHWYGIHFYEDIYTVHTHLERRRKLVTYEPNKPITPLVLAKEASI